MWSLGGAVAGLGDRLDGAGALLVGIGAFRSILCVVLNVDFFGAAAGTGVGRWWSLGPGWPCDDWNYDAL